MHNINTRQVHLDFHTSELIPDIAAHFEPEAFADMVQQSDIDSVTVFARCHHGWVYYPSEKYPELIHPELKNKNLMLEQVSALHSRGISAPVYVTVQWDYQTANNYPQWLIRKADGAHEGEPFTEPGFYQSLCVNTGYYDFLAGHVAELCELLGDELDGIFFDIVQDIPCLCAECRKEMKKQGVDMTDRRAVHEFAGFSMARFKEKMTKLIHGYKKDATVFYNGSHIGPGIRKSSDSYTHFEIESLPGGFWGYQHFPITARYVRGLGKDSLGMTGKFHTEWGDFHSLKNQAALEYECFRSLSMGMGCSIGDQMEPGGTLSPATYRLIGNVYRQVKKYEEWARPAVPYAEAAVITSEQTDEDAEIPDSISGAVKMLEELAIQFDIVDSDSEFERYRLLFLPDDLILTEAEQARLNRYVQGGGKVISCAVGGLNTEGSYPECFGAVYEGMQEVYPDFIVAEGPLGQGLEPGCEYVIYRQGVKLSAAGGEVVLGSRAPYFKREGERFCSHRYTPSGKGRTYPAAIRNDNVIMFGHPLFGQYRHNAPLWCKILMRNAIGLLLPDQVVRHNGPSHLGVHVLRQQKRICIHLLSYIPVRKSATIDIIEERTVLHQIGLEVKLPEQIRCARLASTGEALEMRGGKWIVPVIDGYEIVVVETE